MLKNKFELLYILFKKMLFTAQATIEIIRQTKRKLLALSVFKFELKSQKKSRNIDVAKSIKNEVYPTVVLRDKEFRMPLTYYIDIPDTFLFG